MIGQRAQEEAAVMSAGGGAAEGPVEMPDVSFAVLAVDGELRFGNVPSRAVRRGRELYQDGPWEAAREAIGGPCPRLPRIPIGAGLIAWVADESLIHPADYPENSLSGRTVSLIQGYQSAAESDEERWAGTIVITAAEDLVEDEWCGAIWPLDEEQRWIIAEAHRAARGEPCSMVHPALDDWPEQ
jgi:hypothetical protein